MSEDTKEESNVLEKSVTGCNDQTVAVENKLKEVVQETVEDTKTNDKTGEGDKPQHVEIQMENENNEEKKDSPLLKESKPEIIVNQPLCADYESSTDTESDSDSSSDDSDSDSSTVYSDSDSSSQESSDDLQDINDDDINGTKKSKQKDDLDLSDLPPIENLRISVPEEECQEIGIITSIVNTLVVVQAYKDTSALDIDSVLFLEMGQKSLGRIFDVLGPVSEPVYTVRFNNAEEIAENNITKGQKVYCAPKTEYASFVFVSELMKMKGSDASWKNNEEAPPEYQDFSDDEEENTFKHGGRSSNNANRPPPDTGSRKKGRVHQGPPPGRAANYRNPFALGHSRNQRYNQRHWYPPGGHANPSQPPFPPRGNQFYDGQNNFHRGGMPMVPPYQSYPQNYCYPYQQYPAYPMQQFAMPPVMPSPPPPPPPPDNPTRTQPSRVFGSNIQNPKNG